MRELVTIDVRGLYAQLAAMPDKRPGVRKKQWTSDEDWILWTTWNVKRQSDIAKVIGIGIGACKERYDALAATNGPQGVKPEWMK